MHLSPFQFPFFSFILKVNFLFSIFFLFFSSWKLNNIIYKNTDRIVQSESFIEGMKTAIEFESKCFCSHKLSLEMDWNNSYWLNIAMATRDWNQTHLSHFSEKHKRRKTEQIFPFLVRKYIGKQKEIKK